MRNVILPIIWLAMLAVALLVFGVLLAPDTIERRLHPIKPVQL